MRKYTDEMISFLRTNAPGKTYREITELFNSTFNLNKTTQQLSTLFKRHKIKTGTYKTFTKGHIPHNKGKKGIGGWEPTQFKKGHIPANYKPIGSERIDKDGYILIKVADPNIWKSKQKVIYEREYGSIPKGHVVIFADRDNRNFKLDNLILISKRELLIMNRDKLIRDSKELTKTGHIIAKLKIKVDQKKKKIND
ncbi:HNH endonuclease signature motif containing protein [uncultured Fusobacterium sp.]|mgnify:FL=1|uniref:HNH endonuclease signature motif containing protein n=1 Tax=uncultured Fusobacterium sp. TaxID=159267 RepID=UPI0027DBC8BF|nr:HNH endonuclease signature motif containing protein [uncultured Fusobacterium sp.]